MSNDKEDLKARVDELEEELEITTRQVGRLTEKLTQLEDRIKQLENKDNEQNPRKS